MMWIHHYKFIRCYTAETRKVFIETRREMVYLSPQRNSALAE